jgi:hypothetical protein
MVVIKVKNLSALQKRLLFYMVKNKYNTSSGVGLSIFDNVFSGIHKKDIIKDLELLVKHGYLRPLHESESARFTDDGFHESYRSFKFRRILHSFNPLGKSWLYKLIWIIISAFISGVVLIIVNKMTMP